MRPNRLVVAILATAALVCASHCAAAERVERSTVRILGNDAGFQEARYGDDGTVKVHFEYNDRGRGPKSDSSYRVADDGRWDEAAITGVAYFKTPVDERFTRDDKATHWKNGSEDETRDGRAAGLYASLDGPPEEGVLMARALLAAGGEADLLPVGHLRIAEVATQDVRSKDGTRAKAVLYAISGSDLTPVYLWLDGDRRFLASYSDWQQIVREGFDEALPALAKVQGDAEHKLVSERAKRLTHRIDAPLVIDDVRVFDPESLAVKEHQRVVVRDGRIAAVGDRETTAAPAGAESLPGGGHFLMPGLWDMHVHVNGVNDGLLYIASGITTVRDLANDKQALDARIAGFEDGSDIGPRVVRAGFVDGRGPYAGPTKVFVDNEDEARAAIDQFAKDGFVQLKMYSSIKPELVPLLISYAHEKGLRVSGHVPQGLSARQFVDAGADEIQHANFLFLNFLADASVDTRTPQRFTVVADRAVDVPLDGAPMQEFIAHLRARRTVIDPTLVTFEGMFLDRPGKMGPTYYATVGRLPANWQRAMRAATGGLAVTPQTDLAHRESYRRMIDLVGLMYRSGVTVVAGTDAFPLFSLARELELYTHAGIPPAEVLRIATLGAARVMKRDGEYGKVAPGYAADLVLIDGDPTKLITDVRRVRTVVRGDRWFDAAALYESVGIAR